MESRKSVSSSNDKSSLFVSFSLADSQLCLEYVPLYVSFPLNNFVAVSIDSAEVSNSKVTSAGFCCFSAVSLFPFLSRAPSSTLLQSSTVAGWSSLLLSSPSSACSFPRLPRVSAGKNLLFSLLSLPLLVPSCRQRWLPQQRILVL